MYTQKDNQMALDSDFGLMIWDGISKGTKANIDEINTDKQFVKEKVVQLALF